MENLEKNFIENSVEKNKEKEITPEAQAAATMERADFLVKEVKSSKRQIQNIMININNVLQAIQALRTQLQLAVDNDEEISSVTQDKRMISKLKRKIEGHKEELLKMKDELINIYTDQLKEKNGGNMTEELKMKAQLIVEDLLSQIV